jgi:hypothetical protein
MSEPLTSFWIVRRGAAQTQGFGVTGFSVDDALQLVRGAGHELPVDRDSMDITPGVRPVDLDAKHVVPNCGPAVVRGVWYPFTRLGA